MKKKTAFSATFTTDITSAITVNLKRVHIATGPLQLQAKDVAQITLFTLQSAVTMSLSQVISR